MNENKDLRYVVDRQRFSTDGDIRQAMSADVIATTWNSPPKIRQPFTEDGELFVTTSMAGSQATAYKLTPTSPEAPEEKCRDGITNRKVQFGDDYYIITEPAYSFSGKTDEEVDAQPASTEQTDAPAAVVVAAEASPVLEAAVSGESEDDFIASLEEEPNTETAAAAPSDSVETETLTAATATQPPTAPEETGAEGVETVVEEDAVTTSPAAPDTIAAKPTPAAKPAPVATPPEIKKTYTELLPDRTYNLSDAPLKIYFHVFESDGQLSGREIRITAQLYTDAPLILRVRESEVGGFDNLFKYATEAVTATLDERRAAYALEQQEASRQVQAKQEKDIAEKLKQKAREKKNASKPSASAKPAATASPSPSATAASSTGQDVESEEERDEGETDAGELDAAASDETDANESDASEADAEDLDEVPVVSDDSVTQKQPTAPIAAPPSSVTKRTPPARKASDTQPGLFG